MDGPEIIARSISAAQIADKHGNVWQYLSRSDRHSKVASWVIAFDLMQRCALLRQHLVEDKVIVAVHHTLTDFQTQREKNLDLVIARPSQPTATASGMTFAELANKFGVVLTPQQRATLAALPTAHLGPVGSVLVAVEAKVAMTEHVKALPRLHDELDSSHSTTHGNSEHALAVAYVIVNAGEVFRSADRNRFDLARTPPVISEHKQPYAAGRVIDKIKEIRRRSGGSATGFDAIGVTVVDIANDGSPVRVLESPDPVFQYDDMIERVAHEYSAAFGKL